MFSAMANPKMTSVLLYRPPNPPRGRLGGGKKSPQLKILCYINSGVCKGGNLKNDTKIDITL